MPPRKEQAQVPTLGRIVHFTGAEGGPMAALIVRVNDNDSVNLEVYGPFGLNVHRQDVPFSDSPTPGCWSWPPRV